MRPQTGEILALVGGRDYRDLAVRSLHAGAPPGGQRLQALRLHRGARAARRSARSSRWPTSSTILRSRSQRRGTLAAAQLRPRIPRRVPVREALERSLNVATARLAQEVGIGRVADVARRLGVESPLPLGAEPRPRYGRRLAARDGARLRDVRERRCPAADPAIEDLVGVERAHARAPESCASSACSTRAPPTWRRPCSQGWPIAEPRGRSRDRAARADRGEDRDHRRRARPVVRRLHARARRRRLDRVRRAAQPRCSEQRGRCPSGGASCRT